MTMRAYWALCFFAFLIACQTPQAPQNITPTVQCTPPYYEYTPGDCCLDKDTNRICDRDEPQYIRGPIVINKTKDVLVAPKPVVMSDVLIKFRQNVTGYSFYHGKAQYFVKDKLVHVMLDPIKELSFMTNKTIRTHITDIYVDREEHKATGYCDPRTEEKILGTGFKVDRSVCMKLINVPIALPYEDYNPVLPEDWLEKFKDMTPTRVETTDQYIKEPTGWKLVNPVLYFVDATSAVILRLESRTGLPVKVETSDANDPSTTNVETYTWLVPNDVKSEEVTHQPFAR